MYDVLKFQCVTVMLLMTFVIVGCDIEMSDYADNAQKEFQDRVHGRRHRLMQDIKKLDVAIDASDAFRFKCLRIAATSCAVAGLAGLWCLYRDQ